MTTLSSRLEKNWRDIVSREFETGVEFEQHMARLEQFLQREKDLRRTIYPRDEEIFNALNSTAFDDIKVVIIGQDPYHKKGQAHGLCFSVPKDIDRIPRSLKNIYKEIEKEYCPMKMPSHGDLTGWAKQGVLLLNATLTVREAEPRSHEGQGWEDFTDAIIRAVSGKREPVIFLLWGASAQKKRKLIVGEKHLVLEASHPAPRSAYRSFLRRDSIGCGHFKKANVYLKDHGLKPVEWERI
jgi:uracil-DNA glycosylase